MSIVETAVWGTSIVFLFLAGVIDYKAGKIPNWLTYPLILLGFLFSLFFIGTTNIILSFLILLIGPFIKNIGMGDIKALVVVQLLVGSYFGLPVIVPLLFLSLIFSAALRMSRIGLPMFFSLVVLFFGQVLL